MVISRVFADFLDKVLVAAELKRAPEPPEPQKETDLPVYLSFEMHGQLYRGWYPRKSEAVRSISTRIAEIEQNDVNSSPELEVLRHAMDRLDAKIR